MKVNKYKLNVDAKSKKEAIHDTIASMNGVKAIRVDSFANTVTVDNTINDFTLWKVLFIFFCCKLYNQLKIETKL